MATRQFRVEFIRFALLLTMTVALISVATRSNDHGAGRNEAGRGHHPSATASPARSGSGDSAAPSETPSGQASTPAGGGTSGTPSAGNGGTGGHGTGGAGANGAGTGAGTATVPTLPRTGGTQTVDLAALAMLFIAAGSFSVRISRPKGRAQPLPAPAAAAHLGQAVGAAESNLPGTV